MSDHSRSPKPALLERIARRSAAHPWLVVGAWVLLLVGSVLATSTLLGSALTTEQGFTGEPEAARASRLIQDELRGPPLVTETVIIRSEQLTVEDPEFRQMVTEVMADIRGLGDQAVQQAVSYLEAPQPEPFISEQGHATVIPVTMAGGLDQADENIGGLMEIVDEADKSVAFEVLITGQSSIGADYERIAEADLLTGELFGSGIALIILLAVFGTLVAALLPLGLAILAIAMAVGLSALVGQLFELAFFVTNMITMMGLAVGIDYSLFIVSRFREERNEGRSVADAIGRTGTSATRAVLFSGTTVILALAGLVLVPITTFRSLAVGAILVVLVALAASLTLLPAAFSLLGDRIDSGKVPFLGRKGLGAGGRGGFWDRVAHGVMNHPWISTIFAVSVLLLASVSYLGIEIGTAGVSSLPERAETKRGFEILQRDFSLGLVSPLEVAVVGEVAQPEVQQAMEELTALIAGDPSFSQPTRPPEFADNGRLGVLTYSLEEDPNARAAQEAVERVRGVYVPQAFGEIPAEALVTGATAQAVDFSQIIDSYTPLVFAFILGLSFILLTVVFRSVVIPLKAIIMNLLSVGAAYGLLVLVFQEGYLRDLLGFQQIDVIETWIPLFLFAILFGLSMDYQVFLLSRIREHYDNGAGNRDSVAFGLRSTAGIITGAAAIMIAVFAGFAAGDIVVFQQLGFGLGVAIFLDATLVRVVLVPAAMRLLGDLNWYFPSWLEWLPDLRVEALPDEPEPEREA